MQSKREKIKSDGREKEAKKTTKRKMEKEREESDGKLWKREQGKDR